jgi:hypothetical protein
MRGRQHPMHPVLLVAISASCPAATHLPLAAAAQYNSSPSPLTRRFNSLVSFAAAPPPKTADVPVPGTPASPWHIAEQTDEGRHSDSSAGSGHIGGDYYDYWERSASGDDPSSSDDEWKASAGT